MASRDEIVQFLDQTLANPTIKDSSCNTLQVQGVQQVRRVALAVDACLEAYQRAVAAKCQMLIVHHGLIWDGIKSVTGRAYEHVRFLIEHGLNLYGSHLLLDVHPEYGNNARLARLMGLADVKPFGEYHGMMVGYQGTLPRPTSPRQLARGLAKSLGGHPVVLECGSTQVRTVGIVSGGAGDMVGEAAKHKLDCYVTGEAVHHAYQLTRELAANVIFLGHYHSEKLGVQALGELLTQKFGVESVFLEIAAFDATNTPHEAQKQKHSR